MNPKEKIELLKDPIYPDLWDSGSYCPYDFTLNIKGNATIEKLKEEKENANCYTTLIHEYVHYIQYLTTTFGCVNLVTYIDIFSLFFAENNFLDNDPVIPTFKGIADSKLKNKNYENFIIASRIGIDRINDKIVFSATDKIDFTIIKSSIYDPYRETNKFISYVAYNNELIPLNELVLCENMAIVASYLSSGLSLDEAKQTINRLWRPQYHIIYSFINNLFPDKDCLKLTYIISEMSLLIIPFNQTITKILEHLTNDFITLDQLNEDQFIENIRVFLNFDELLKLSINNSLDDVGMRILTCTKHEKDNEFFTHIKVILNNFKKGLTERLSNPFTYQSQFDNSFLNYHEKIIKSPILVFSDNKKTMLGDHQTDYINSIALVSGILTVFHKTYYDKLKECPFSTEPSLCALPKGTECTSDPISIYGKKKYKGCLLHNSLSIIGLKKEGRT